MLLNTGKIFSDRKCSRHTPFKVAWHLENLTKVITDQRVELFL